MDHVYVASLMIISQEVEPDIYVFGSGVQDRVLCNAIYADMLSMKMGTLS